jgi:uncharacterized protein YaeQ
MCEIVCVRATKVALSNHTAKTKRIFFKKNKKKVCILKK